jgi:WD40 repeat protein
MSPPSIHPSIIIIIIVVAWYCTDINVLARSRQGEQGVGFRSLFDTMFPDELRIFIFSYLDVRSLCRAEQVCIEWRRLTNDPSLWCNIHSTRWGRVGMGVTACKSLATDRRVPTHTLSLSLSVSLSLCLSVSLVSLRSYDCAFDWKEAVKGQHILERNWNRGKYHTQTLRGHSGYLDHSTHTCCANHHSYNWVGRWVTCVDLHTNKLVSSSYDGTVRVWNTQTGNCLQTLPGDANNHEGLSPVWCCKFKGSHIMAGSSDSKIRQWDMNTGQMVRVFEAHAGGVKCLQVC